MMNDECRMMNEKVKMQRDEKIIGIV